MIVLTAAEMRAADAEASAVTGAIPLMRRAGKALAERVRAHAPAGSRIVAFAGPGNNGGDGFAALAELASEYRCVVYARDGATASDARRDAAQRAGEAGVEVRPFPDADAAAAGAAREAGAIVDAIFGTGSRLPVDPAYHAAIRATNAAGAPVIAADLPTGIDADTGNAGDPAIRATETVTFGAAKPGLLLEPSRDYVGRLIVADIGFPVATLQAHAKSFAALDDAAFCAMLPQRHGEADKRSSGAPLIVAGSEQFPGAAVLCARGAARAGAGYVTVIAPQSAAAAIRAHLLEQVVVSVPDDAPVEATIENILDVSSHNGSIGIGPGLGLDERTGQIVRGVIARTQLPVVADASALFHLAKSLDPLRGKSIVVTPHAGEFARLSGKGTVAQGERVARLREFVERTGIATLLKGNATLLYDGGRVHINTTGSNALATAGTGDVLTGIIATLLSQGLKPLDAGAAAAYWHGLSGRYAERARRKGVIAGDVAESLGFALPEECA